MSEALIEPVNEPFHTPFSDRDGCVGPFPVVGRPSPKGGKSFETGSRLLDTELELDDDTLPDMLTGDGVVEDANMPPL